MSALDAGYDIKASGVTLDRFCGSGITANNIAAHGDHGRHGGPRGRRRHRDDVDAKQRACCRWVPATPTCRSCTRSPTRACAPTPSPPSRASAARTSTRTPPSPSAGPPWPSPRAASTRASCRCRTPTGPWPSTTRSSPGPSTTAESLAELPPSFPAIADYRHEGNPTFRELINQQYPDLDIQHVHHAGNSSGVVDGAAAILLASPDYAKAHGLKARARVVATANMGDDPTLMLNAPVPAARKVLAKAGMTMDDIDIFEINEAFAVVSEKFQRDLDLDRSKVNVNGGAMALGHPIGATGAMLIGTVLDELERTDGQFGLITMCAGGGMAPAIIIERV